MGNLGVGDEDEAEQQFAAREPMVSEPMVSEAVPGSGAGTTRMRNR
jgi:hypothetical protein